MGGHKDLFTNWMEEQATSEELTQGPDALIRTFISYAKKTGKWGNERMAPYSAVSTEREEAYNRGFVAGYEAKSCEAADFFDMDEKGPIR